MRADRLVAVLLLLQARGSVTAREVAEELEVSERTARRDLDALAMAGVPVFSKRGRGGGWELIGGARTDLTGLHSAEARALLTMAAANGHPTPEFASAMHKLTQALPAPIRVETDRLMTSVLADKTSWGNREQRLLHETRRDEWLEPLQDAVLRRRSIKLGYQTPRKGPSSRRIDPLGLVFKRGSWYLLADSEDGHRSFRVDRIVDVLITETSFEPPAGFDLSAAWDAITTSYVEQSSQLSVEAVVLDRALPWLRSAGVETVLIGPANAGPDGEPTTKVILGAWNAYALAGKIAGIIDSIELVDAPPDLTERLEELGRHLATRFAARA